MSGNDSSATATLTPTSVTVVPAVISTADEEEEEDPVALTLDCVESGADMDLVNGPNPWLPAYGFQLQHHSQFQPAHLEDLRANDTVLVQQIDFLETILEETSDDLQSDSDRSGTTYWLGSDSETESVIHIKTKQRSADERLDGSGSECNSVVPKKRRRRDHGDHHHHHHHHHQQVTAYDEYPASPRSSRSTASSRSSSLLQFESLERTCATLSPSSYSFDSLEYSNRSNASHPENDSPDSLEQDYDRLLPNGFASSLADHFPRIRPYRSFESLDKCQKDEGFGQASMSNGFTPLYLKRGADLSKIRKNNLQRPRDFWHEDEEYEDDDEEEDDEYDFEEYERSRTNADSRLTTGFEDRLLYGESGKYATSLDYRNTIDLREIGMETKRDALLVLKSGQKTARLNIAGSGAEHHHHHHHHHHHQHPQQHPQQQQQQQQYQQQQYDQHDYHHHHHRRRQQQHQGWSDEERFNFRFTDKSQSAPSLLDGVEESARSTSPSRLRTSRTTSYVSTSSLFENYTRVASVPVDLNLCGVAATCDDEMNGHEMAETAPGDEATTLKNSGEEDTILKENDDTQAGTKVVLTSSVRTQPAQGALMDGNMEEREKENEERTKVERANDRETQQMRNKQTRPTSTVKTQDRSNCVLDIAMVTENDLDEAIKQFKREVEEAAASGVANAAILAMETIQRTSSGRVKSRKVKNNASYELAQQLEVDERNFQMKFKDNDEERDGASSPGKKRVLNNASYELAQQCDYIKALQSSRAAFQRMDACDELDEAASGRSSKLNVTDVMRQMGSDTNISEDSRPREPQNDSFFGQIKKNSDPFSACGDASALSPRLLDDEVDYPCLETKPIGASCLEDRVVLREKIESEKPTPLKSVLENSSTVSSYVDEESPIKRNEEETGDVKKSFIDEFYPERAAQLSQSDESEVQERKINSENASSDQDHEDRSRSPGPSDRGAGECLWRVVIEKQAATKKEEEKEEEKRDSMEAMEKKEVEEEGHSVRGVGSESPPGGTGSLGERSSGKPAVVVAAVDTNHRGGDCDKRQGDEQQRAPSINKQDASVANAKRSSSLVAPKREPARTYAVSSTSLPSSSSSAAMKSEERKKGGLGGFLQRFSRLRFSGRTKVPRSETHKKVVEPTRTRTQEEQQPATAKKKEPDYIIIPLHPPEEERRRQQEVVTLEEAARRNNVDIQRSASSVSNGRAPVSSKPPLPPQPPRVAALGMSTRASASASASASRRRAATDLGNPAAIEMAKARAMQAAQERPVGLLETDLDEAVISTSYNGTTYTAGPTAVSAAAAATAVAAAAAAAAAGAGGKKTRSLLDLNHTSAAAPRPRPEHALHVPQSPVGATHRSPRDDVASAATSAIHQRPHKSMEFLLDKENLHFVKPPENELQKVGERVPSEHELRVQRSLQRLNVPDWYKNSPAARDGFRLKRHSDASQHGGWRALGSKTTSLSSLSSSSNRQPTTGVLLSPSPTPPVFSRWSTSLLNSAGSSPASSARSSFNHRQPYLGWRSQERLTNPRTPAERLAQGILPQLQATNKQQQQQQQTTNQQLEVRNSIKEVTSAIVHYVQSGQEVGGGGGGRLSPRPRPEDWDDRGGARSTSPRGSVRLCWMESSFVGTRPVDSPETPMSLATDQEAGDCCNAAGTESCSCQDSAASGLYLDLTPSRDDVRQQHLQTSSAGPSPTSTSNYHHHHHRQHRQHRQQQQQRHHRGELLLA